MSVTTAAEAFTKGNAFFVDELFTEALEQFNQAIELDHSQPDYFVNRSAVHLKLQNWQDVVSDCNKALELNSNLPKALLRKGQALFNLEEYESAKQALEKGENIDSKAGAFQTWIRKCDLELKEEAGKNPPKAQEKAPPAAPAEKIDSSAEQPVAQNNDVVPPRVPRIRHEWYQNMTHIMLSIFAKKVQKEQLTADIQEEELSVTIKLAGDKEYNLDIELGGKVVPAESKVEILGSKVELKLKKAETKQWVDLEKKDEDGIQRVYTESSSVTKLYPSSKGDKNWDKLANEEVEAAGEDKPEGEAALNKLFQDIFSKADPDTRRAMEKSFVESKGTVLSTNWKDIGAKKVEGSPPDGMEFKNWEQ